MLALPFAMKGCGVIFGSILVLIFWALSWYTGRLVLKCMMPPISGGYSYADLAKESFGPHGTWLVDATVMVFVFGGCVGYLVIIGDVLTPYINQLFVADRRLVMLFFGGVVCFPLSALRKISLLKYTSVLAIVLICYLVMCIVVLCIVGISDGALHSKEIVLFSVNVEFLSILPIISFAFTFHTNVPLVWLEMSEFPSDTKNVSRATFLATCICCVTYLFCGIFGYLSFAEETSDNILTHYNSGDWYLDVGKIGYSGIIMFSYPLLAFPLRASFDNIFNTWYLKNEHAEISYLRSTLEAFAIFALAYVVAILPIGYSFCFGCFVFLSLLFC